MTGRDSAGSHTPPLHPGHDAAVEYELIVDADGSAYLTCGGEVMWVSDGDDDYAEEFGEEILSATDEEATDAVVDWLTAQGYIPPDVEIAIMGEGEGNADL